MLRYRRPRALYPSPHMMKACKRSPTALDRRLTQSQLPDLRPTRAVKETALVAAITVYDQQTIAERSATPKVSLHREIGT